MSTSNARLGIFRQGSWVAPTKQERNLVLAPGIRETVALIAWVLIAIPASSMPLPLLN